MLFEAGHGLAQASGDLSYGVPAQYDERRPAFLWSEEKINISIMNHPLASHLPSSTNSRHPTLHRGPEDFHELVSCPNHATTFSDWTETDRPAFAIHIVSFEDVTLLIMSWPHIFLDALGQ